MEARCPSFKTEAPGTRNTLSHARAPPSRPSMNEATHNSITTDEIPVPSQVARVPQTTSGTDRREASHSEPSCDPIYRTALLFGRWANQMTAISTRTPATPKAARQKANPLHQHSTRPPSTWPAAGSFQSKSDGPPHCSQKSSRYARPRLAIQK